MNDDAMTPSQAKQAQQIQTMAADVADIKEQLRTLNGSLERMARLEERQINHVAALDRAFKLVADNDDRTTAKIINLDSRVKSLEVQEPITSLVRGWVIGGVIGVVSMVGISAGTLIYVTSKPVQPTQIIIDSEAISRATPR